MQETDHIARTPQYSKPTHNLIHISDTQLLGSDGNWRGYTVDADANLAQLMAELESSGTTTDAIIFTGDLADEGDVAAYTKLKAIVEPVAERLGAQVIWVMGNHDKREPFRTELLREDSSAESIDKVYDVNGLRVIVLDSTVPGEHYGLVSDNQLIWLARILSTPAEHGTIVAMHHPPLPCVQPLAQTVELQDQKSLAAVLRGSDVKSIIAGHLHYSSFGSFAGIPVSVASSSCYTQDLVFFAGGTRGRDTAQAYNLIGVYDETTLHSVVPIGQSNSVGKVVPPAEVEQILKAENLYAEELVSY